MPHTDSIELVGSIVVARMAGIGARASSDAQPQIIGSPPKAAVAGSPVTNRRSEPVSVVAAGLCQCRVALPPRFCIGTLTFGDHPVLFRGRVSPPARAISRIGSPQIRRWAVVRPFSNFSRTGDKNSADRRTIRHARFVATVHGPEHAQSVY